MKDTAKVFKVETFGAVDGPSIRLVIFLQGCSFRCKYCHNPESWEMNNNQAQEMSIQDILTLYEQNSAFYKKGGITFSGGEPMLQADFIKLFAQQAKAKNIHIAIDTSACNFLQNKQAYEQLIDLVDLWIVDIKSLDQKEHEFITGSKDLAGAEFVKYLEQKGKPFWIRQVIIKTINANNENIEKLASFVKPLKHCQKAELLSYHNLAYEKYNKLAIPYPFKDIQMLTTQEFDALKNHFHNLLLK
ncbi:MAG: pyruvate formate lyase-activating protein [Mycoplasma sp.]|nr:pyruvate formate lyase-activating protein [Candidatus Hennigella equi]